MLKQMFSTYDEANDRNYTLMYINNLKSIPSYCIWSEYDIQILTIEQRMNWWKNIKDDRLYHIASEWVHFLEKKMD